MPKVGPVKKAKTVSTTKAPKPKPKVRSLRTVAYPNAEKTPHLKCDKCGALFQSVNCYNLVVTDVCGVNKCDGTVWPDLE